MEQVQHYRDHELLALVRQGDESAFAGLFHQWYPRLLSYILKVTDSQQVAEDIVQDVFTRIWMNRFELPPIDNFQGYLFVMARNQAFNELEKMAVYWKKQKQFAILQDTDPDTHHEDPAVEMMESVLCRLTPRQREIWILNRRHRYTYEEIAGKLGISRETVKTHLQTATRSLTEMLSHKAMLLVLICQI